MICRAEVRMLVRLARCSGHSIYVLLALRYTCYDRPELSILIAVSVPTNCTERAVLFVLSNRTRLRRYAAAQRCINAPSTNRATLVSDDGCETRFRYELCPPSAVKF